MPPCARLQWVTVADLVTTLGTWGRSHPEFEVGTNEAGMALTGAVRAADAAIWRRTELGADSGLARVPPVLAAEVAGRDESEIELREKARWYLDAGVAVVWCLLPEQREVLVVTRAGESRHRERERLPCHAQLPELAPLVDDLFAQVVAHGG